MAIEVDVFIINKDFSSVIDVEVIFKKSLVKFIAVSNSNVNIYETYSFIIAASS